MSALSFPNDFSSGTTISSSQMNANFTAAETWSLTISDDNFSSSSGMYSAFRTIHEASAHFSADQIAGTFYFDGGAGFFIASGTASNLPLTKYLASADYSVSGRTTKLRVRAVLMANATAPGINYTIGLYPVTVAGGADALVPSLGTIVSTSNADINAPLASTATQAVSAEFNVPTTGHYALGVVSSGTLANNSAVAIKAEIQQRWT